MPSSAACAQARLHLRDDGVCVHAGTPLEIKDTGRNVQLVLVDAGSNPKAQHANVEREVIAVKRGERGAAQQLQLIKRQRSRRVFALVLGLVKGGGGLVERCLDHVCAKDGAAATANSEAVSIGELARNVQ